MAYPVNSKTIRVELPTDGFWVDLKTGFDYGDMRALNNIPPDQSPSDILLIRVLVAWNIDDEAGNVLPITMENLEKLSRSDALKIINIADGYLDDEDEDVKKNSLSVSSAPSTEKVSDQPS